MRDVNRSVKHLEYVDEFLILHNNERAVAASDPAGKKIAEASVGVC